MCFNIDSKTSTAKISFSREFYSREAIEEAIKLFKEAEFTKENNKNYLRISMKFANSGNLRENALEFCNLVLAIVKGAGL